LNGSTFDDAVVFEGTLFGTFSLDGACAFGAFDVLDVMAYKIFHYACG
jgi:hypothetical protein